MASLTDEEYAALAGRAYAAFKLLANVHSVGIGGRERAGKPTGEIVLKVFVSRKQARDQLDAKALVPAQFEGVGTDVVEMPESVEGDILGTLYGVVLGGPYLEDNGRYRPLKAGSQIEGGNRAGMGTLGFLATVQGDARVMAVTCKHVLFPNTTAITADMRVGQPTPDESFTQCCQGAFGTFKFQHYDSDVDAAVVQLDPATDWLAEIEGIGNVRGTHDLTVAETSGLTYAVRKRGFRTGPTGGTVQALSTHGTTSAGRSYTNGIAIKPNPDGSSSTLTFGDHGDSGSAIVNADNEIVGLLFSVNLSTSGSNVGWGTGFPIKALLDKFSGSDSLSLQVATASTIGAVQHTAAASPDETRVATARVRASAPTPLGRRLAEDFAASDRGRLLTGIWLRHSAEVNRLLAHSRRVAVGWQRSGGAAVFQAGVRAVARPDNVFPAHIDGRGVDACVAEVLALFEAHGSEPLRADAARCRSLLPSLAGRSYREVITELASEAKK
jgi:hypothetical protein